MSCSPDPASPESFPRTGCSPNAALLCPSAGARAHAGQFVPDRSPSKSSSISMWTSCNGLAR
eukprot:12263140-Alexandrium_andersonii.AAC.1